jgi:excisionase family DNA binding protein
MTPRSSEPTLLTVAEAARRLGVQPGRVYRLIRGGRLPASRNGRQWRVEARFMERGLELLDGHAADVTLAALRASSNAAG